MFAEVGEKDPNALLAPYRWVQLIRDALAAGATKVICEGAPPATPACTARTASRARA